MAKFFISYSRSVKNEVSKVVDLLRASRHEVWWDGDIPVMADWWATILQKIEWCEVFIFVASDKSVESPYCLAELKYANDRQRPVLPFMLDDPTTLTLPPELPSRNQWLIYNGDPAAMLRQINIAYDHIDWRLHHDVRASRPPEPQKDGKSIAQLYQSARQLANDGDFEQAKLAFRNIKSLDYEKWGSDCEEWIARITSYATLVDLAADVSTLEHAQKAWGQHVHEYGDDFDPLHVKAKIVGKRSRSFSLPLVAGGIAILVILVILRALLLSGGDESNDSNDHLTSIELAQAGVTSNADWVPYSEEFNGVEMVLVPTGQFTMGSTDNEIDIALEFCEQAEGKNGNCSRSFFEDETPINIQTVDAFWIDRTEVTRAMYQDCVDANACPETPPSDFSTDPQQPINRVTWYQAQTYCQWRGGYLPSEVQWEYAARGPDGLIFPWGNDFTGNEANYCDKNCAAEIWANGFNYVNEDTDDGYSIAAPTGSYPLGISWIGALDLGGNMWEWINSLYQDYPYISDDGREDITVEGNRGVRGGSFIYGVHLLRAASRNWDNPNDGYDFVGFRCAHTLTD